MRPKFRKLGYHATREIFEWLPALLSWVPPTALPQVPHISRTRPLRPAVYIARAHLSSHPTERRGQLRRTLPRAGCKRHAADNAVLPVQRACWHLTAPPRLVSAPRDLPLFHSLGCCTSGCRSGHTRLKLVEAAVAALLHKDREPCQSGIVESPNQRYTLNVGLAESAAPRALGAPSAGSRSRIPWLALIERDLHGRSSENLC